MEAWKVCARGVPETVSSCVQAWWAWQLADFSSSAAGRAGGEIYEFRGSDASGERYSCVSPSFFSFVEPIHLPGVASDMKSIGGITRA